MKLSAAGRSVLSAAARGHRRRPMPMTQSRLPSPSPSAPVVPLDYGRFAASSGSVTIESRRSFASGGRQQKQKQKGKKQDSFKQQIKANRPSSSSIIGKRPGQTSFSPPKDKTASSQPAAGAATTRTALQSAPNLGGPNKTTHQSTKPSSIGAATQQMPLIVPPSITDETLSTVGGDRDNKDHAHHHPSISSITHESIMEEEDNALRSHFLRQGILPPPDRPVIDRVERQRGRPRSAEEATVEIPEPDPSGVSHANPEDILDMASMYDPSIHLPDKPDFNAPTNRARYEAGTPLTDELIAYIGVRGPITVAEFMRRVLRDVEHGYYTSKGSKSGAKKAAVGASVDDDLDDDNDWDLDDVDEDGAIHASNASGGSTSQQEQAGGERIIGSGGDFITAPEVSQLFGEAILVWLMTQYQTLGNPDKIQIVEIGPGKGTLICDIVRSAVTTFPDFASALTSATNASLDEDDGEEGAKRKRPAIGVHLVEVTNGMRARQRESIRKLEAEDSITKKGYSFEFTDPDLVEENESIARDASESPSESKDESQVTIRFSWHDVLSSVPTHDPLTNEPVPTFVICQELVDALPVHSFQKNEEGVWRERLVDVAVRDDSEASGAAEDVRRAVARRYASAEPDDSTASTSAQLSSGASSTSSSPESSKKLPRLRFVLPPDTTPALRSMLRVDNRGSPVEEDNPTAASLNSLPPGSIVEACPEGLLLVQDIADRIERCGGGASLIIDYGGDGSSGGDTLRGFRRHAQVHPLSSPGEVDVTADVDFGALREAVNRRVSLEESLERKRRREEGMASVKTAGVGGDATNSTEEESESESKESRTRPEAFGPITQGKFLAQMGVVQRVERKIEDPDTTDEEAYEVYSAMERLMAPDQMGERYKVLAIAAKKAGLFPPPAF